MHRSEGDLYSVILRQTAGIWAVTCKDHRGDLPEYEYYSKLCAGMPKEAYQALFGLNATATTDATPAAAPTNQQPGAVAASPATPAHAAPAANVPTASRAAMLITVASDPQRPPAVSLGSVVWTSIPPVPGEPATLGVKAEADIPDLKIHAIMTIRKNTDPSFAASHTIDLRVTFSAGSDIKGVKDMRVPLMRRDDPPAQDALTGARVKISDNNFLVGLNHADADAARNVDLIATRGWFDFPLVLNDDRLAKLTFEKGEAGDHILSRALSVWKAAESPNAASVAQNADKPSFDCATAKSGAARLICGDAELSKADADLGKAFQAWLAPLDGADKSVAIKSQVAWIHVRDTECGLNGKEEASIETLAAAKTCILRTIQSRTMYFGGADVTAPPTTPTVQQTGTAAPPPGVPNSAATKTTATIQTGAQMPKAFSMVDIFDWLTHIVLLLAAFGMLILILTMILGLSKSRPVEATMRAVACACGLLLYISSKAIGLSLPDLVFNALATSFPWKVGLAGIIAPSCLAARLRSPVFSPRSGRQW
jgi:uncharacterized protein YecT (DUF1311 family)